MLRFQNAWWWPLPFAALLMIAAIWAASFAPWPTGQPCKSQNCPQAHGAHQYVDPRTPEERLADYTLWLERFTGALVLVAALEIVFLFKTDQIAGRAADLAEKQMALAESQRNLALKQHGLTREQYFATHRPRIVIKNVFFASGDDHTVISIDVSNSGGSEATVIASQLCLAFAENEVDFRRKDAGVLGVINDMKIGPGEVKNIFRIIPEEVDKYLSGHRFYKMFPDAIRLQEDAQRDELAQRLYFYGSILYVDGRGDEFGFQRLSVFRRLYQTDRAIFERTDNPDHEYAD